MSLNSREIVVVDVGVGNLRSVERALVRALQEQGLAGYEVVRSADPARVRASALTVMPGQGAFGDCAAALERDRGALTEALAGRIADGGSYLGVCLGLQILFDGSEEAPGCRGLGVFKGSVRKLREGVIDPDGVRARLPHIGWNLVDPTAHGARWFTGDEAARYFYFVHSYAVVPEDDAVAAAVTTHGERFVSAVQRGNLLAVQFHPEKSQAAGIALLRRYLAGVLA